MSLDKTRKKKEIDFGIHRKKYFEFCEKGKNTLTIKHRGKIECN